MKIQKKIKDFILLDTSSFIRKKFFIRKLFK